MISINGIVRQWRIRRINTKFDLDGDAVTLYLQLTNCLEFLRKHPPRNELATVKACMPLRDVLNELERIYDAAVLVGRSGKTIPRSEPTIGRSVIRTLYVDDLGYYEIPQVWFAEIIRVLTGLCEEFPKDHNVPYVTYYTKILDPYIASLSAMVVQFINEG